MLITVCIIAIIIIIFFLWIYFNRKKYENFIRKNSISLKQLLEINKQYTFYPYKNFDQTHTYDNENFYNDISCSDFLIYQLQYLNQKICDQAKKINMNEQLYRKYRYEIERIQLGEFELPIGKLKLKKLLKTENIMINKNTYESPITKFSITVTLYCSTINGQIYNSKQQSFTVNEIFSFINRLKNKRGSFYNDREIWNSLCRVERGKVSNKMRFSIYERDGYRCRRCGISGKNSNLEIDHIIPISKGGKSTYDNLQTLCHKCNYEKSDGL